MSGLMGGRVKVKLQHVKHKGDDVGGEVRWRGVAKRNDGGEGGREKWEGKNKKRDALVNGQKGVSGKMAVKI